MAKNYCDFGYCGGTFSTWLLKLDEPDVVLRACEYHEEYPTFDSDYRKISDAAAEAIRNGFPVDILFRECDDEGCHADGEIWVLWGLDDDDDDETVGRLCPHHALVAVGRKHADVIDEDEAIEIMTASAGKEAWASLEVWGDSYVDDVELLNDELGF